MAHSRLAFGIAASLLLLAQQGVARAQCPDFDGDGTPDGTGCSSGNIPAVSPPTPVDPSEGSTDDQGGSADGTSSADTSTSTGTSSNNSGAGVEGLTTLVLVALVPVGFVLAPGLMMEALGGSTYGSAVAAQSAWNDEQRRTATYVQHGIAARALRESLDQALANARAAPAAPVAPRTSRPLSHPPPPLAEPVEGAAVPSTAELDRRFVQAAAVMLGSAAATDLSSDDMRARYRAAAERARARASGYLVRTIDQIAVGAGLPARAMRVVQVGRALQAQVVSAVQSFGVSAQCAAQTLGSGTASVDGDDPCGAARAALENGERFQAIACEHATGWGRRACNPGETLRGQK